MLYMDFSLHLTSQSSPSMRYCSEKSQASLSMKYCSEKSQASLSMKYCSEKFILAKTNQR